MSSTTSADDHPLGEEMTTTPYDQPRRRHLAPWLPFIRHYIEMVLADELAGDVGIGEHGLFLPEGVTGPAT